MEKACQECRQVRWSDLCGDEMVYDLLGEPQGDDTPPVPQKVWVAAAQFLGALTEADLDAMSPREREDRLWSMKYAHDLPLPGKYAGWSIKKAASTKTATKKAGRRPRKGKK